MNSPIGFNSMSPQMMNEYGGCGSCQSGGKRKLSAYNKFVKKEFAGFKAKNPSKSAPEILKLVAKKWRESKH